MASGEVRTFGTAHALWASICARYASRPAFRHRTPSGWVTTTYSEAHVVAQEIAGGLCALGLVPGDRVCILSETRLEWMLADIACVLAGAVSVPVYPSATPEQTRFVAVHSGARFAIAEDAAQLEKLLPEVKRGLTVVYIADDTRRTRGDTRGRPRLEVAALLETAGEARARVLDLATLRQRGRQFRLEHPDELTQRGEASTPQAPFTIIYTSGTTGQPKGVVIENEVFTSSLASACRALTIREDDEQYLFLPLAHVLGREMAWASPFFGAVTSFSEGLAKIRDNLLEIRPTFMAGVPRIFEKFHSGIQSSLRMGSPARKAALTWAFEIGQRRAEARRRGEPGEGLLGSLADRLVFSQLRHKLGLDRCRFLISGGAPLAPEIAAFFLGVGLLILEGYGLTETMSAAFVNRPDRFRFGTVGPAIDVITCRIAEDGEILLRGPSVFKSYHQDPEATREAIDPDGWFHTGDVGLLEDGFLRITDRKKDLIVLAGGKKVAPQPLENALKAESASIGQAMVYGDKRPYCVALLTVSEETAKRFAGDSAKASVDPQVQAEIRRAVASVNESLASFETIRHHVVLPIDFTEQGGELTPSLKVKRKVVSERYRRELDKLYQ
ncbi:MAG: long-chain fatty acid--CoA ligase [Myxococcales bacterium]|nr:long-chain fatty acid--CoA ligase [Myxococcales bacterium]